MTSSKPDVQEVFNEAIKRESLEARLKFLKETYQNFPEVRDRVEALLRAHSEAGDFLGGRLDTFEFPSEAEKPGTQIGPYKLLDKIGEGGMGVVYLVEQHEQISRRVALKIIKPGMDTKQVIARFEAERQALAMMDHPSIAKVLDAGETALGRPYFVMELVNGMPITEYCDQERLTTNRRLRLFLEICKAIQHAHQKGIIHRDIKPSNVLVTVYDGIPVPKVIDFGIAKATNQQCTEKTLFTSLGQLVGTPSYMSPEQAGIGSLDIDTRSDIYSLGVLLYELVTGTTPFEQKRLKSAGFAQIQRIIADEEPPRPSARLMTNGDELGNIADKRGTDPKALIQTVRGDLDWITMKAIEKERQQRYSTVMGLAEDIERYLNNEPVNACPPSSMYRFKKFVKRNKKILLLSMLSVLALIITIFGGLSLLEYYYELEQLRSEQGSMVATRPEYLNLIYLDDNDSKKKRFHWSWRLNAPADKDIEVCFANSKIPRDGLPVDTYIWRERFDASDLVGAQRNGTLIRVELLKDTSRETQSWRIQMTQDGSVTSWPLKEGTFDDVMDSPNLVAGQGLSSRLMTRPVGQPIVLLRSRWGDVQTDDDGSPQSDSSIEEPRDGFMLWLELKEKSK